MFENFIMTEFILSEFSFWKYHDPGFLKSSTEVGIQTGFIQVHICLYLCMVNQLPHFCLIFLNTLTSGLIQAVRKKTAGSDVALCGNISAPVWVTDLVEVSKDVARLVVCTRKKIFLFGGVCFL